ncbi:MAG: hypothetical protein U1U88_001465 [Lawsonella clevelandensis]
MLKLSENQTPKTMFGVTDLLSMQDLVKVGRETPHLLPAYPHDAPVHLRRLHRHWCTAQPDAARRHPLQESTPPASHRVRTQIGPNHMDAFRQAQPLVQRWMADRFAGKPAPNTAIAFPEG